jgi:hypothetical protein
LVSFLARQCQQTPLTALIAQQQPNGTPAGAAAPQQPTPSQAPQGYQPPGLPHPAQPPNAPYFPPPSNTGSVDLSNIKPVSSGSVSIADAIAKARNIAENRGISSYDPRQQSGWSCFVRIAHARF